MRRIVAAGHRIRLVDSGGQGAPVVFVADAPVVLEHYASRVEALSAERWVIAFEMPGFGYSTPARSYRFSLPEQVEVLRALLDALRIDKAMLAFSCVNGFVALSFATTYPERVERLVLQQIASASEMARWAHRIDVQLLGRGLFATPLLGQRASWAVPGHIATRWFHRALSQTTDAATLADQSRAVYASGGAFSLGATAQVTARMNNMPPWTLTAPTTVVWGDADRTHAQTDRDSLPAQGAEIKRIHWPDVGHCPDLEAPEAFARLLT